MREVVEETGTIEEVCEEDLGEGEDVLNEEKPEIREDDARGKAEKMLEEEGEAEGRGRL